MVNDVVHCTYYLAVLPSTVRLLLSWALWRCAAISLICWALWPCDRQSDMLGSVAMLPLV